MITQLSFAAPFVYSSKGTSPVSIKSRELRNRIKRGDSVLFRQIADHVADLVAAGQFPNFFGADVTLVPVPGHTPIVAGAISTTQRISRTLAEKGLAAEVNALVVRSYPVPKSALAAPTTRPRARDHFASMAAPSSLLMPRRILLVDDFVTRGATLLGAASRIRTAYPECALAAFVLVRSITHGEVSSIRDPCVGNIFLQSDGESSRRP